MSCNDTGLKYVINASFKVEENISNERRIHGSVLNNKKGSNALSTGSWIGRMLTSLKSAEKLNHIQDSMIVFEKANFLAEKALRAASSLCSYRLFTNPFGQRS